MLSFTPPWDLQGVPWQTNALQPIVDIFMATDVQDESARVSPDWCSKSMLAATSEAGKCKLPKDARLHNQAFAFDNFGV